jgi:hypothetical protein
VDIATHINIYNDNPKRRYTNIGVQSIGLLFVQFIFLFALTLEISLILSSIVSFGISILSTTIFLVYCFIQVNGAYLRHFFNIQM